MREVFLGEHLGAMPAVTAVHDKTKIFAYQLCLATCGYTDQTLRSFKKICSTQPLLRPVCLFLHFWSFTFLLYLFLFCALTLIISEV